MKHTAKTVKYNMNLAKKRLNVFSSRLGKTVELDEDYFLGLSPAKADEKLKQIRWSNTAKDKGGVSYRGIKIDDAPAPRRRIVREEPKKIKKDRTQQKEITKEINKAQARLKSATKHTGLTYYIDREKIRSMSYAEAKQALNQISYKNMKKDVSSVLQYVKDVRSKGTHPLSKIDYDVKIDKPTELTKAIIEREKVWKEVKPARVYGKTAQEKVLEYYEKYNTKEKYEAFKIHNAELAENNLIENFKAIANSGDKIVNDLAQIIIDLYHDGTLTIDNTPTALHNVSEIDMYDSDVPTETIVASAERLVKALVVYGPIDKEVIKIRLRKMGNTEEEIEEILGGI